MAFGTQDDTDEVMNEINMTPLVDVMLVLLVIFMLAAPLLSSRLSLNLPKAESAKPAPIAISVPDGLPFESEDAAIAHVLSKHLGEFFDIAEVEVDQDSGKVVVKKMFIANDSGPVSNPDGLRNQMEGGAMQGMSRALHEEVIWDADGIRSVDWRRFPVYKFGDVLPVIETVLIDRKDKDQMGAGETIITVVAAAIANAIFDATGARVRQVPFTPDRVLAALAERK